MLLSLGFWKWTRKTACFPWRHDGTLKILILVKLFESIEKDGKLPNALYEDSMYVLVMDCSPPGSSGRGISQARIQEWVAISFSRGSFQPRDWTCISWISCIGRWILYHCAPWEAEDSITLTKTWKRKHKNRKHWEFADGCGNVGNVLTQPFSPMEREFGLSINFVVLFPWTLDEDEISTGRSWQSVWMGRTINEL